VQVELDEHLLVDVLEVEETITDDDEKLVTHLEGLEVCDYMDIEVEVDEVEETDENLDIDATDDEMELEIMHELLTEMLKIVVEVEVEVELVVEIDEVVW
jgi:hypothetical protein